jgi:hypothetical protein
MKGMFNPQVSKAHVVVHLEHRAYYGGEIGHGEG